MTTNSPARIVNLEICFNFRHQILLISHKKRFFENLMYCLDYQKKFCFSLYYRQCRHGICKLWGDRSRGKQLLYVGLHKLSNKINDSCVPHQTAWQYSDGYPLTGASNAGGVGRNRDSEPISGFTACREPFQRQVQYTKLRRTIMSL